MAQYSVELLQYVANQLFIPINVHLLRFSVSIFYETSMARFPNKNMYKCLHASSIRPITYT